jgi:hypothetical protein
MRIISLFVLVACSGPGAVFVDPMNTAPLGVGFVQGYQVTQAYCAEDFDIDCPPRPPMSLSVDASGDEVEVQQVSNASFQLLGAKPGGASLTVTGDDDISTVFTVAVADVGSTTLSVERHVTEDKAFPSVESPVSAFVHSVIPIHQQSVARDGEALSGEALLALAPGSTAVLEGDSLNTSAQTTTARVSTDLAMMTVNIVDGSAIADFAIGDATGTDVKVSLVGQTELWLLPADAGGHPIVGLGGPQATFEVADPSILTVVDAGSSGVVPSLVVRPIAAGSTTMTITWGSVAKTFTIDVIPSS